MSDPGAEETLYDSRAMQRFVGIYLGNEPVPDETTLCSFCHLMERNNLGDELFPAVNACLTENGMKLNRGTMVDATIPRSSMRRVLRKTRKKSVSWLCIRVAKEISGTLG
ncbi:transposase [Nitrosococcus oceani]|uniref:transposase n=1 Tax=Nitrosococcus oceani TaxID=1229 RepID=UPI003F66B8F3